MRNPFEERFLVIAEKPGVAKTIASVLGCRDRRDGYIEGPDAVVSWCIGHLAEYAMPEEYDESLRKWSLETLPIIPEKWKLVVPAGKAKQFGILKRLLQETEFEYVVNACDAGREGELIFGRVYELSGSRMPVKRLWISSMEDEAIREGFRNLKDGTEYYSLAAAAICRAQADWLVGMNATRAFTKAYDYLLTVGRVQTPTLAMLSERDEQISNFRKQQYYISHLLIDYNGRTIDAVSEHYPDKEEANRAAGVCYGQTAALSSIERKTKSVPPPKLYDLTTLQRDANRLFGFTAEKTLSIAQALYERKLITYPRTDSNYLTDDMAETAKAMTAGCRKMFPFLDKPGAGEDISRMLDSKKVSDHHAIIPTGELMKAGLAGCSEEEAKILALTAVRLMCAVGKPHVYESTKASFLCCGYPYTAAGRSVKENGWREVYEAFRKEYNPEEKKEEVPQDLSSLYQGQSFPSVKTNVTEHWTTPPKHFTEDTLLLAMERAGNKDMDAEVEKKGLGTPATRAAIIEKLVSSRYAVRKDRQIIITEAGKLLVSAMPEYLRSPKMTADWENLLLQMEKGKYRKEEFLKGIREMVERIVTDCRQMDVSEKERFRELSPKKEEIGKCPVCGSPVREGKKNFYCSNRDCSFVLWKESRFLETMKGSITAETARQLLSGGRARMTNLYSYRKNRYFTADLLMEWKNDRAEYSLSFPRMPYGNRKKKGANRT